jgi:putative ABC transport system permease protein
MSEGASVSSVRDELDALFVQLGELYPEESTEKRATVTTLRAGTMQNMQRTVIIFYAVVSLLLLLVCANVANLLLARGSARERELAVRASLGAGRWRIVRQLFTESLLLALSGGTIGLLLGSWGRDLYLARTNMIWPSYLDFSIDPGFIALLLAITLMATLVFGLFPAVVTTRSSLSGILGGASARVSRDRGRAWHQNLLVGFEIGLATMVLIAGGLMLKSFIGIQRIELGFDPENVVHMEITLDSLPEMTPAERIRYYDNLIARIEQHPLVVSAAAGNPLPYISWENAYEAESGTALEDGITRTAMDGVVTPGFMETLGMPLVMGRDFSELDYGYEMNVVIVSERLAEINWPGENPLGKRIRYVSSSGREYPWMEVIGVVSDTRAGTFQPDGGWMWVVNGQVAAYELIIAAKVRGESEQVLADMKQMVWDEHPDLALAWSGLLEETVRERWYDAPQLYSVLLGIFSILALLLACVGVYGVISYTVTRRAREFGIRLSIGARPMDVIRQVLLQGSRLILFGIIGGLIGAIVLTRLAASLFFGVDPHDPVIYLFCILLLTAIALLATWLPARRAARVDPVDALRIE